jgi:LDH2 family malate/lactate/ureidoglycolate dehydrogenase
MTVKYTKVNEQKLLAFSTKILGKAGIPSEDAAISARLMVNTDLRGIASHGVAHLKGLYIKRIKTGFINSNPDIKMWSGAAGDGCLRWRSWLWIRSWSQGDAGSNCSG